jgi:hypothetical protein
MNYHIISRRTPFSLDVDDINDDDVKDILKSLQIGKASGGDFISHQNFFTCDQNAFGLLEFSSNKPLAFK